MRNVGAPLVAKVTVVGCDSQYAPFCQPQPFRLHPLRQLLVARLTSSACVVLTGYTADPLASASENWTHSESFHFELPSACMRSHRVYGVPAGALNVTSKKSVGEASALFVFAMPVSGVTNLTPFGELPSVAVDHEPRSALAGTSPA